MCREWRSDSLICRRVQDAATQVLQGQIEVAQAAQPMHAAVQLHNLLQMSSRLEDEHPKGLTGAVYGSALHKAAGVLFRQFTARVAAVTILPVAGAESEGDPKQQMLRLLGRVSLCAGDHWVTCLCTLGTAVHVQV